MIKTLCAKFRKQNHQNNTLFVFLLTRGRLFVTKCTFLHTLFLTSTYYRLRIIHNIHIRY